MDAPSPQLVAFGRQLRRLRRHRDLTQQALGNAAGVSPKDISEYENASREPRFTTAVRLIVALDLAERELCDLYRLLAAAR